jgi:peptidylprolyl isomerase
LTDPEKTAEPAVPEEKTETVTKKAEEKTSESTKQNVPAKGAGKETEKKAMNRELAITIGVAVILIAAAVGVWFFLTPVVATKGDTVSVYYTGTFDNGTVFDSNKNSTEPLVFTLGNSTIIPGFADAVSGMALNSEKTITLPPEKAYGNYDPGLVQVVNRTGPLANVTFVPGQHYIIHDRLTDTNSRVTVINVTPKTVTIDSNSPYVGQNVTFTIQLVNITKNK